MRWIILISLLTSCTCDWHLKRAKLKCNVDELAKIVTVHDTTYVDRVKKDTVFRYDTHDTVIVREGRLTMKYFYNRHDSTVFLSGKCDTIKIIKEIQVPVTTEIIKPNTSWVNWVVLVLLIALLILYFKK